MSAIPLVINKTMKYGDWMFDAEDGTAALRKASEAKVLDDEVFYQFGELPQRMQQAFMNALRAGDTEANDREVGRIMRAAFKRAVDEDMEMYLDRLKAEASMKGDE
ncbi:hypothetical protein PQQ84_22545 [Paraburkholderia strydomiana]|uniref:hypothetical protein n=1 Tax=Paraburkholderia strydomiana TaxID=1245417 RepID=UPI0038BDD5CB